jgi:monoamine oxidase
MAHTPLLRLLADIARDNALANFLRTTPDEVRAERARRAEKRAAEGMISRRQFLGAGAAAAATLALPRWARASSGPRIAIIGGGISGLSAALTLADAGYGPNITVYEASNRMGGRMYSNTSAIGGTSYWNDNQVTEWCGELIDSAHTTVRGLAQRFNCPTDDLLTAEVPGSVPTNWFQGGYYSFNDLTNDFAAVSPLMRNQANASIPQRTSDGAANVDQTVLYNAITPTGIQLDNTSVQSWIQQYIPGGYNSRLGLLLDAAYSSEYGCDANGQSSLNMLLMLGYVPKIKQWAAFGPSDERYHIRGGNQTLPIAIANYLGSIVQKNSKLTKIARTSSGGYDLNFTVNGQAVDVQADYVILTIPFAVMADAVDYSGAGFDSLKQTAITQLGRGLCSKLQLQFNGRPWLQSGPWGPPNNGEEVFSDIGDQCSWEPTRGQGGTSGILNSYTGGTPTVQRANTAPVAFAKISSNPIGQGINTLAQQFLSQLGTIFPGTPQLWNGKATLSLPHLDPNFKLAYSYWKTGQYQQFAGYERVPQGNCFFAGEHTSVNFQGFMEGGAAEGVRAANQVLAAVKA